MDNTEHGLAVPGVVLRAGRGVYTVQTDTGRVLPCSLRGNLKKNLTYPDSTNRRRRVETAKKKQETDPLAVGDRVEVAEDEHGRGVIEAITPRRAALARRSGNERERQTIVANLELAVIVFAAAEPRPDLWKIDRFLVLAEDAELDILLVLNKADLASESQLEAVVQLYQRVGYDVLPTSVRTNRNIDALRARLRGKISAFAGPSGVGKSTLLNALEPGLALKTGAVGDITFKGRHTTVASELLPLSSGGWVADTPGLRQVEFWDLDASDVAFCFPEMAPLIGRCKFADCRHRNEPGCAVQDAVAHGQIDPRRYESYQELTKG